MSTNKPENMTDEAWNQHLRWLELVGNECKANKEKQEREKHRSAGKERGF